MGSGIGSSNERQRLWVLTLPDGLTLVTHGVTAEDAAAKWPAEVTRVDPLEGAARQEFLERYNRPMSGRPALGALAKMRVVTVRLSADEHDSIAAIVARANAARAPGTKRATVSGWIRDAASAAVQASCTPK